MTARRILVVEDEPGIALGLEEDLTIEGYQVETAADGRTATDRARREAFDLILLDVMLPGKDGFQVCRELRKGGVTTPIILLTARAQEAEKVLGLQLGADDYVTKPFSPLELRARIEAVLRRAGALSSPAVYTFGDATVDFARCELRRGETRVDLTAVRVQAAFGVRRRTRTRAEPPAAPRRRVGRRAHGRPGRRHARVEPAQEDRARSGRAQVSRQRARAGVPLRWLTRDDRFADS